MARKEKTIHYIYKTTCNVTGKWYVGMHSTSNLDDNYLGSGTKLRHSIRKHGPENHTKEILEFLLTREVLVVREIEIVNRKLISEPMCMNLKEGGYGGFINDEHMMNCSKAGNKAFLERYNSDEKLRKDTSDRMNKIMKDKHAKGLCRYDNFKDKKHSEETKKLISETKKNTGVGQTNSQFGTCWVTKEGINKKIKKENLEVYLNEGWVKGRV
jgi:hypothetical protein